ncbi:MAG: putative HTH-type transcriptional regulatorc [Candidatus Accumulibacter regalis]|jgi:LysR family transcriptional regulator (chromosome initiation inhibitor)|uniref:HTH-type transcriptional regulatorc n=1 Tax=Accumulibacter regalis TaxID=522306 RepID=A0A011RFT2_ACCRE|nr:MULTISPECIES: LysR family transcriptional regulator ArgP [unclassified Candidatus Accumulibacter]EXI90079.1 MAG: putative HTH-type transcriptional regulatorc [Candidatus Accumulibacter regalis]MQM34240.1 LysR family transcriptional regulator ArgP [Candidatus Accumulibacter phosphatis]MBL8367626.1 LysR family transcriptional regulator ArgP [Accumulibacter sp.]MBN8515788.1 LysR family transcriptional regulator ArgP [Accumulibacter sp.]MBO3703184.1 LysR family transcriptional regulator ArgP [A
MKIDNAQLAAFAEAIREGSFDLAARKLNVTPSAISQRVKLLEERIGQVLIQRSTPCQATAAGRPLLRYAEELALLEAEALTALGVLDAEGGAASGVRIPMVINADSLDSWFLDVFDDLAASAAITLDLRVEDQDHSLLLLRKGAVMAGVSASPKAVQGCRVEPLGVMRYLALASPPYVERYFAAGVDAETLNAAPMLMFNKKDGLQQLFLARLIGDAVIKPPTHYLPTTRSFAEAVRRGMTWGMIPEQLAETQLKAGQLIELAPQHCLDVPLFWHRWRIASSALDSLSQLVHGAAGKALRAQTVV